MSAIVAAHGVRRVYRDGHAPVVALDGVDLTVEPGRLVAVHGRSGAGKTTLLNLLGGLDRPDQGRVEVDGTDLTTLREADLLTLRRTTVAYVFQSFGLLPTLSAAENVGVPLRLAAVDAGEREERVRHLLGLVGLGRRGAQRPDELSGGEKQRVAIARALAGSPKLLLADEPTGQLDSATGRTVMALLRSLVDEQGVTVIVATHDPVLLETADEVVELLDGHVRAAPVGAGG